MAVTGGYAPGTYQAADLNRLQAVFGTAGIARGMVVQQSSPLGMSVLVSVGAQGDGVCYLPNGGWVRIDAALTLSVPSNSTGGTRNDAVVATMDPTGASGAPSIAYVTNWAGGFGGGTNNQLVLALVAVPNNATQIVNGNITDQTTAASFGSSNTSGNLLPGGQIQTTGTSTYIIFNNNGPNVEADVTTQLGTTKGLLIAPVDASGVRRAALIGQPDGSASIANAVNVHQDSTAQASVFTATSAVANSASSLVFQPNNGAGTPNAFSIGSKGYQAPARVDDSGNLTAVSLFIPGILQTGTGGIASDGGGSIYLKLNTVGTRIFASATTAGISFNKYDLFVLLPFS